MNLHEWIEKNLFTVKRKLNNRRMNKKWFIENGFSSVYENILDKTKFLDELDRDIKLTERLRHIYNDINDIVICSKEECINPVCFSDFITGHLEFCSVKCSVSSFKTKEKVKQTCLKRFGTESVFQCKEIKDKIKKNNLKKYGTEYSQSLESTKEKYRKTCMKKYGVDNASKSKVVLDKMKQKCMKDHGVEYYWQSNQSKESIKKTNMQRYGVENSSQIKEVKLKRTETFMKKYGVINPSQSKEIQNTIKKNSYKKYGVESANQRHISKESMNILNSKELMEEMYNKEFSIDRVADNLGVSNGTIRRHLQKHGIDIKNSYSSQCEKEIIDFIGIEDVKINTKQIISPYELDVYIPSKKLAIEYNGLYWHSDKPKNYHLMKTQMCIEKGIRLLHIFENEWLHPVKQEIWKSMIRNKLGKSTRIYGRQTEIREVTDNKHIREFLDNNHLQGHCPSSIKLGLFYNDELISLMTFGKTRFSKKYEYEIIRFCNKRDTGVVGGASKLYKYFVRNYKPKSVISYADRRYSDGGLYNKLGFEFSHYSAPNYFYFLLPDITLYSRVKFQKHKLSRLLESFDPDKSEVENMMENNYRRIFDCGNVIYVNNYDKL